MFTFKKPLFLSLILAHLSTAHFIVNLPPPLNSNINNEDVSPCGGFTPDSSTNFTSFHVGGDAIGVTSLHAQAYFAYRGLLGTSLTQPNWTDLLPIVQEFGLNSFCEPSVAAPASWAGSNGLLQVIQDAEDGVHYQCIPVNFIAGAAPSVPSGCSNSSGVSAAFASDPVLSGIEGGASPSSSGSSTQATGSPTSSGQASPSATKSAALLTRKVDSITSVIFAGLLGISLLLN